MSRNKALATVNLSSYIADDTSLAYDMLCEVVNAIVDTRKNMAIPQKELFDAICLTQALISRIGARRFHLTIETLKIYVDGLSQRLAFFV